MQNKVKIQAEDVNGMASGVNNGIMVQNLIEIKGKKTFSHIAQIISELGDYCGSIMQIDYDSHELVPYKIEDKLDYNHVVKYKTIILNNSVYYDYCDRLLNTYDDSHPGSKNKIFNCVKQWYEIAKGEALTQFDDVCIEEMDVVRQKSDYIIEAVVDKVNETTDKADLPEKTTQEDLNIGCICFICYCFMECKILEKPMKEYTK